MSNLSNGNFPRYLKYAIGEILLVVIGILLALQINSWHNYSVNRKIEKSYMERLSNELKSDIEYYTSLRDRFLLKEEQLKRIVKKWQSENPVLEDSVQYIEDFHIGGAYGPWYDQPVTWTQLQSTGDAKLIKNQELLDDLFRYYAQIKKAHDNFLMYPMEMTNKARDIYQQPFSFLDPDQHIGIRHFEKPLPDTIYKVIWENRKEYINVFSSLIYISRVQYSYFKAFVEDGSEVIELLEAYKNEI